MIVCFFDHSKGLNVRWAIWIKKNYMASVSVFNHSATPVMKIDVLGHKSNTMASFYCVGEKADE